MPSPTRKRKRNASGSSKRISRRTTNKIRAAEELRNYVRRNPGNTAARERYVNFLLGKRLVLLGQVENGRNARYAEEIENNPEAQETIAKMKRVCDTFQRSGGMIGATPYGYNERGLTAYPEGGIWEELADACSSI
jgi:hypothetical protein